MFKSVFVLTLVILGTLVSASNKAGVAMSMNEEGLRKSKDVMMHYLRKTLKDLHLDDIDFDFLGNYHISNIRIEDVDIRAEDLDVSIIDDFGRGWRVAVNLKKFGARLSCHSHKKILFGSEDMDFSININYGGIGSKFNFFLENGNIDGKNVPIPVLKYTKIFTNPNLIRFDLRSTNVGAWIVGQILHSPLFTNPLVRIVTDVMNTGIFQNEINDKIRNILGDSSD
jgi:hypothetical protein